MSEGQTLLEVIAAQYGPDFVPPRTYTTQHYKDMAEMMYQRSNPPSKVLTKQGVTMNDCDLLWYTIVEDLGVLFTIDNPQFNEDKFKEACGF